MTHAPRLSECTLTSTPSAGAVKTDDYTLRSTGSPRLLLEKFKNFCINRVMSFLSRSKNVTVARSSLPSLVTFLPSQIGVKPFAMKRASKNELHEKKCYDFDENTLYGDEIRVCVHMHGMVMHSESLYAELSGNTAKTCRYTGNNAERWLNIHPPGPLPVKKTAAWRFFFLH